MVRCIRRLTLGCMNISMDPKEQHVGSIRLPPPKKRKSSVYRFFCYNLLNTTRKAYKRVAAEVKVLKQKYHNEKQPIKSNKIKPILRKNMMIDMCFESKLNNHHQRCKGKFNFFLSQNVIIIHLKKLAQSSFVIR